MAKHLIGYPRSSERDIRITGTDGYGYASLREVVKWYGLSYEPEGKRLALTNKSVILEYPEFTLTLRRLD